MGVLSKGTDFTNGDQVTDTSLDNLVDNATFTTSAVDEVSTDIGGSGSIIVKDGGITTGKLADSTSAATGVTSVKIASSAVTAAKIGTGAVTTVKILDDNVTTAKILDANVTFAKLADVIDDDTMATATATTTATSESIKAYVDSKRPKFVALTGGTNSLISGNLSAQTLTWNIADYTSSDVDFTTSSITGIVIQATTGSDVEAAVSIYATLPSGAETLLSSLHDYGTNTNQGISITTTTIPINAGQVSFDIRYSGGTNCNTTIHGAIIN